MRAYRLLLIAAIAVTAVAGCRKHERPERQNPGEGGSQEQGREQQVVTLKENKTWSIEYGGRQLVQGTKVEIINVTKVPANTLYLVSVINRENYSTYEGKLKEFLEAELEYAVQNDYIYSGDQTIQFDPFRHGTWYAFIIGIDSDKKLTGEYAYLKFTVEEEEPTEDYLKWIGNWTATDGKFTYNLKVSQLEANFIYRVAKVWEPLLTKPTTPNPSSVRKTGFPKGIGSLPAFFREMTMSSTDREIAPGQPISKVERTLPMVINLQSNY